MDKRKTMTLLLTLLALVALALSLAACGGSSTSSSTTGGATSSTPVKGGTLRVSFQGEPTSLDPARAWEIESWAIERLCYETFLNYASEPDAAGTKLVPWLATEVPTAENGGITGDGTIYTFHLRKGVKFQPPVNREMTAEDFKASFLRMLRDAEAPTYFYSSIKGVDDYVAGKVKDVEGYKVVDPYTVQITLNQPDPQFLYAITMPFASVMPKEYVNKKGVDRHPLGTGPFVIKSWKAGQEIVAERNPNYWREGEPYLDGIHFDLTSNPSTALLKLQSGDLDIIGDGVPAADYNRVKSDPTWSKYTKDSPEIAFFYVFMNVLEKPYDNQKVRQAINYAVNIQKIQKLLAGQAKALNQVFPEGMPGYDANATFYSYDPAKAKELLKEAGYPNGFKTTFYAHNVEPFPKLAQSIQNDLKAVGITADIKLMDRATYWDFISLKKSGAGIGLSDWYQDFPDPSDWIGPLFTNPVDGGQNASFWSDPEVDSLYAKSNKELDSAKRIELFSEMQKIIMDKAPVVPMYQPVWNGMWGKDVGGYYYHPVWNLNYQDFWKLDGK